MSFKKNQMNHDEAFCRLSLLEKSGATMGSRPVDFGESQHEELRTAQCLQWLHFGLWPIELLEVGGSNILAVLGHVLGCFYVKKGGCITAITYVQKKLMNCSVFPFFAQCFCGVGLTQRFHIPVS